MRLIIKTSKLLLLLSLLSCISSCNREEIRAERSLVGRWKINTIISIYDFDPSANITDLGNIGFFDFNEHSVDFNFTRNDTVYSGSKTWNLDLEKLRSGFFREPLYTLDIEDEFIFDVLFSDGTRNAEKNAQEIIFSNERLERIDGVQLLFQLERE